MPICLVRLIGLFSSKLTNLVDATARTFPISCSLRRKSEALLDGLTQIVLTLRLHQALQLPGHAGVEWFEDLILPPHAFLVVNRHVSQGKIIVGARKVGF